MYDFHGGEYEEYRILGYKTPVRTSQKNKTNKLRGP
jgi:hypothetical protein